jgi:hypothetical protein
MAPTVAIVKGKWRKFPHSLLSDPRPDEEKELLMGPEYDSYNAVLADASAAPFYRTTIDHVLDRCRRHRASLGRCYGVGPAAISS